jgi:carbonic anhydrase
VRAEGGVLDSKDSIQVTRVAEANVRLAMRQISVESDVLRTLLTHGSVKLVGAMSDIETGRVAFLD